jgi:hypothetical protein
MPDNEERTFILAETYSIEWDNVKTIKDIKLIMEAMDLTYRPNSDFEYDEIKHLIKLKTSS